MPSYLPEKPFWQSKTFWGVVLTLIGAALPKVGVTVPFTEADVPVITDTVIHGVGMGAELVGLGMTLWGRLSAGTKLTLK